MVANFIALGHEETCTFETLVRVSAQISGISAKIFRVYFYFLSVLLMVPLYMGQFDSAGHHWEHV